MAISFGGVLTDHGAEASPSTPEDVTFAFILFLGRRPESAGVVAHFKGKPLAELLADIATSEEAVGVRGYNHGSGWFAVHRGLSDVRPKDLVAWWRKRIKPMNKAAPADVAPTWPAISLAVVEAIKAGGAVDGEAMPGLQRMIEDLAPLAGRRFAAFGMDRMETRPQTLAEAVGIWNEAGAQDTDFLERVAQQFHFPEQQLLFSDLFFDAYSVYSARAGTQMSQTALAEVLQYDRVGAHGRFSSHEYIASYPDVLEARLMPAHHYLIAGYAEGRTAHFGQPPKGLARPSFREILDFVNDSRGPRGAHADPTFRRYLIDLQARVIAAGLSNPGWVGSTEISRHARFYGRAELPNGDVGPAFAAASAYMLSRYYGDAPPVEDFSVSQAWLDVYMPPRSAARGITKTTVGRPMLDEGISIVTPFWGHLTEFSECAASVALAVQQTRRRFDQEISVEWVIVNDDPGVSDEALYELLPESLRPYARIVASGGNTGTTHATNQALTEARYPWIMFLDCDDMIMPDALLVMNFYSAQCDAKYFASALIDIDSDNAILRFRRHEAPPDEAPRAGMNAGHLKVIHASLFQQYGPLDPIFNSCQDFEFLLRIISRELVAIIPEYLYMYRWHDRTQSVSRFLAQEQAAASAKSKYVLAHTSRAPQQRERHKVGVVIRTQGERNDSLADAILSCQATMEDDVTIVPIVVVHGDEARWDHVHAAMKLRGLGAQTYDCVIAPDASRYRGYPLNVGVAFALETLECTAIGVVDDDDIILPAFAQMVRRLPSDRPAICSGRTLSCDAAGLRREQHRPLPAASLAFENYIPTNGFAANRRAIDAVTAVHGRAFPEDIHYLEDWSFFVAALDVGVEFSVFDDVVGEFRLGSDGNSDNRKFPFEFERCRVRVQQFAERVKRIHGAALLDRQGPIAQKFFRGLLDHQQRNLRSLRTAKRQGA